MMTVGDQSDVRGEADGRMAHAQRSLVTTYGSWRCRCWCGPQPCLQALVST